MQKIKTYLFDNDIFFETKFVENFSEISFKVFDTEISIHFVGENPMIRMLAINDLIFETNYSDDIDEILLQVAIYNQKATECQQQIVVDSI